ncbi:hypothetical protein Bca4012_100825 [Brassica carinata]|uniref:Uncharacterized protein n=1 Tax=Brassica carinata TaxID=52824 RepID=A0A8X7PLR1_BRACI|nr:hypothetical protein Bca52824_083304 [Brassica carinata]
MPSSACNLITFFFIYSVSPNSISNLLLRLHSQNSSFLQNQNQNPLSSFFCVCFPSTPQYHQQRGLVLFYLLQVGFFQGIMACLWILMPLSSSHGTINLDDPPTKRPVGVKAAKGGSSKRSMEDGKDFSAFHNMWSLKEKDLARKEKLKRMCLLDRLLAKTEPLSEEEEALKKKLIREMLAN